MTHSASRFVAELDERIERMGAQAIEFRRQGEHGKASLYTGYVDATKLARDAFLTYNDDIEREAVAAWWDGLDEQLVEEIA